MHTAKTFLLLINSKKTKKLFRGAMIRNIRGFLKEESKCQMLEVRSQEPNAKS
jgi:hypothetical protein